MGEVSGGPLDENFQKRPLPHLTLLFGASNLFPSPTASPLLPGPPPTKGPELRAAQGREPGLGQPKSRFRPGPGAARKLGCVVPLWASVSHLPMGAASLTWCSVFVFILIKYT